MKYSILSICFIGLLFLSLNCRSQHSDGSINLCGVWAYISESGSYAEFNFSDQILTINSEIDGILGPFSYKLKGDSLYYSDCKYAVVKHDCDSLSLMSSEFGKLGLERINQVYQKEEFNSYNPFYLRRCFYLVNRGTIRMTDAIEYLNSLVSIDSIREEIIYSTPKK